MNSRLSATVSFLIVICLFCLNATAQDNLQIKKLFLKNQKISRRGDRLRVLRIVPEESGRKDRLQVINTVYAVDYDSLIAYRTDIDPVTGKILNVEKLHGTPQSSAEERADGRRLLLNDDEIGPAARAAARIEAGFVVDPPPDSGPGRYLEFHILSPDGSEIAYEVFVDIAHDRIILPPR